MKKLTPGENAEFPRLKHRKQQSDTNPSSLPMKQMLPRALQGYTERWSSPWGRREKINNRIRKKLTLSCKRGVERGPGVSVCREQKKPMRIKIRATQKETCAEQEKKTKAGYSEPCTWEESPTLSFMECKAHLQNCK